MKLIAKKNFVFIKDGARNQANDGDLIEVSNKQEALHLINIGFAVAYIAPEIKQKISKKGSKDEKIGQ